MWVQGEISNLRVPGSGHAYFTLKDDAAQLRAVLFRGRGRRVRFALEDGMQVLAFGGIDVYAARGEYQLVVDLLEPQGLGALQLAFEQLKRRLAAEGLFDAARKRPLPAFPRRIALVTSPHGRGHPRHAERHRPAVREPAHRRGAGAGAGGRGRGRHRGRPGRAAGR